jgi:hypothetical protein
MLFRCYAGLLRIMRMLGMRVVAVVMVAMIVTFTAVIVMTVFVAMMCIGVLMIVITVHVVVRVIRRVIADLRGIRWLRTSIWARALDDLALNTLAAAAPP